MKNSTFAKVKTKMHAQLSENSDNTSMNTQIKKEKKDTLPYMFGLFIILVIANLCVWTLVPKTDYSCDDIDRFCQDADVNCFVGTHVECVLLNCTQCLYNNRCIEKICSETSETYRTAGGFTIFFDASFIIHLFKLFRETKERCILPRISIY